MSICIIQTRTQSYLLGVQISPRNMSPTLVLIGMLVFLTGSYGLQMCPCKWLTYRGHYYYFSDSTSMTFGQAEDFCRSRGGYLVKVNDKNENEWLRKTAQEIKRRTRANKRYWLGGTDAFHEGTWKWNIDYKNVGYTQWSPKQPDNYRGRENCLEMWYINNYSWNDERCNSKFQHICEKSKINRPACKCDA